MPWLGTLSVGLENKIKPTVEKCFFGVEQRAIFKSCPLLPAIKKKKKGCVACFAFKQFSL